MLFHSYMFLFAFLPLVFLGFVAVEKWLGRERALWFLAGASLYFYGQWGFGLLALLVASIAGNFAAARALAALQSRPTASLAVLTAAIAGNLGLLGYFKYANFFLENINAAAGTAFPPLALLLPIGISFFTFIQIGYLVEIRAGQGRALSFGRYLLFTSFFAYVTAGPLVLRQDMAAQYDQPGKDLLNPSRIAVAVAVIALGLFKKVVLADGIAPYADSVFAGAAEGMMVPASVAWSGALAYTLQLYFDFSGYSDMALGVGYLFGLRLPLNFNSPLKATSIVDFWRRWHNTMTRFFTTYIYTPIAMTMMRRASKRQFGAGRRFIMAAAMPMLLTFVLAGIWHGAGWTFVVFGIIHGVALTANHAWRHYQFPALPPAAGWLLTMLVVVAGLVFFRADNVPVALALLASMAGGAPPAPEAAGMVTAPLAAFVWIAALGAIVLMGRNTQEIMRHHWFSSDPEPAAEPDAPLADWLTWRPSAPWAVASAIAIALAIASLTGESTFLYYKF
jgi:alginate O-acetyltransferase complex protein AlgI